jgi:DNA replication protein DnaC
MNMPKNDASQEGLEQLHPSPKEIAQLEAMGISTLILDEWLLIPLSSMEARDLLEIVEARHKRTSTIFISQFAPAGWHGKIGEETLADAILDRIVHDSYTIFIEGKDSMRKKKGIKAL